jgi:hypothetical protein
MDEPERTYDAVEHDLDPLEKAYRDRLGDGLEAVLGAGAEQLAEIVEGLNEHGVPGPKGLRWSEELLAAELRRLGG